MARVWLAVTLALATCTKEVRPAPAPTAPEELSLFITSELRGYVGPCGCSESMRGGIDRLAAQVALDGGAALFVDTGNALFGALAIPDEAIAQQERKARAIADTFKLLGVGAFAEGPLDRARGTDFVAGLGLPSFPPDTIARVPAHAPRLAVVRSSAPEALVTLGTQARLERLPFVVGLFEGPFDEAVKFAMRDDLPLDLVVVTRGKDELAMEESRVVLTRAPVVQVQSKGRSVLRVDLFLRDGGPMKWLKSPSETQRELAGLAERVELLRAQVNDPSLDPELAALKRAKLAEIIARREALAAEQVPVPESGNAARLRVVPLETTFPTLPAATAIVTAYDRDVGALNLAWAKQFGAACADPAPGASTYVGTATCARCHPLANAQLETTKHAKAYEALAEKGKQHHLDCVGCHVTGWKAPGGVCRIDRVEGRTAVGCEACHGPGSRHVERPSAATITRNGVGACVSCHDRENSPHFDLEKYLPRVLGPGHGLPALDGGVK